LLVAMMKVHLPYGFSSVKLLSVSASGTRFGPVGYEIDLLYFAALLILAFQGPGPLSIDEMRRRRLRSKEGVSGPSCRPNSLAAANNPPVRN
jgi:putative oxidoreductase